MRCKAVETLSVKYQRSAETRRQPLMERKGLFGLVCGVHQLLLFLSAPGSGFSENEPFFSTEQPLANVTVVQGKEASFVCSVENLSGHKIAWIKVEKKAILAIQDRIISNNNGRISTLMNDHKTWTLKISNVQREDRGIYMCQINTEPMQHQIAFLEVVIPPDITSEDTSSDLMIPEGGTAKLICKAKGFPTPTITWRKEDGNHIIIKEGQGGKRKVKTFEGDILNLAKITRSEMGTYLCIASNGVPPSVSKRITVQVHFHPLIQVPNQLVAAPRGSEVLLECLAEASPRAINYWTTIEGRMIIANEKFNMSEEIQSGYGIRMRLLIRSLGPADFSGYKCISQNSMGATEGTIHIHEINLESFSDNEVEETTRGPNTDYVEAKEPPQSPASSSIPSKDVNSWFCLLMLILIRIHY